MRARARRKAGGAELCRAGRRGGAGRAGPPLLPGRAARGGRGAGGDSAEPGERPGGAGGSRGAASQHGLGRRRRSGRRSRRRRQDPDPAVPPGRREASVRQEQAGEARRGTAKRGRPSLGPHVRGGGRGRARGGRPLLFPSVPAAGPAGERSGGGEASPPGGRARGGERPFPSPRRPPRAPRAARGAEVGGGGGGKQRPRGYGPSGRPEARAGILPVPAARGLRGAFLTCSRAWSWPCGRTSRPFISNASDGAGCRARKSGSVPRVLLPDPRPVLWRSAESCALH